MINRYTLQLKGHKAEFTAQNNYNRCMWKAHRADQYQLLKTKACQVLRHLYMSFCLIIHSAVCTQTFTFTANLCFV